MHCLGLRSCHLTTTHDKHIPVTGVSSQLINYRHMTKISFFLNFEDFMQRLRIFGFTRIPDIEAKLLKTYAKS